MPADDIGDYLGSMTLQKAAALKPYWGAAMQAIIVHAHQCRRITKNQYSYLFRQLSAKGYRKCEPAPIPPEEPCMFSELMSFHRQSLGLTDDQIATHIGELPDRFRASYGSRLAGF